MAAAVFATRGAWHDILTITDKDEEQSHAYLVPVVAAWLIWVRRERMRNYVQQAIWIGPAIVAVGWLMHWVGEAYNVWACWHGGAILVVVGAFLSVAGGGFLIRFLPAFAALVFIIPVPGRVRQAVALPLQEATAALTQKVLETLGVVSEVSGNMLSINGQNVTVAEACNGLRMVFALVMVSFAFAYGVPLRNWFRVLVIVLSPLTAIAFNMVRLVPTVWAYGQFSGATAEMVHDVGGWLMLPCAFFSLLGLMRLLRWAQVPITPYMLAHGS